MTMDQVNIHLSNIHLSCNLKSHYDHLLKSGSFILRMYFEIYEMFKPIEIFIECAFERDFRKKLQS